MTNVEKINAMIDSEKPDGIDTNLISDGYHTFGELYDHRIALFIALCNFGTRTGAYEGFTFDAWKSKLHHDGTSWDGWFIAGINKEKGEQISYHLPMDKWDALEVDELDKAPEWDSHTSDDVIERLLEL